MSIDTYPISVPCKNRDCEKEERVIPVTVTVVSEPSKNPGTVISRGRAICQVCGEERDIVIVATGRLATD